MALRSRLRDRHGPGRDVDGGCGSPVVAARRVHRLAAIRRGLNRNRRTLLRIGVVIAACYGAWRAIEAFGRPYTFFDMKIYHGAMTWWRHGNALYEFTASDSGLGFTYPPFAAVLMLPMAAVPVTVAGWVNLIGSLIALALVLIVLLKPSIDRFGWSPWFTVATALPLAVALEPTRETLGYGQVNLLLFALIATDLLGLRWRYQRSLPTRLAGQAHPAGRVAGPLRRLWRGGAWAGTGIGLATAIKVTPALFIVYLLLIRQWRPALIALGTAVGVTVGTFWLAERDSTAYFTGLLWQTERVGGADMTPNQSLAGLLARLYDSLETPGLLYVTFALVVLVVGLSRAGSAHADGDELAAFTLVGLTANVISPISWTHHLLFVIPAIIVLADAAARRRRASRPPQRATSRAGQRRPGGQARPTATTGIRTPFWFPTLTGLRHGCTALGIYVLFLISPIWRYEHRLPQVSHYEDGLFGAVMENSLALALIVLVFALPWRPGAEPAFAPESGRQPTSQFHLARPG